MTTMWQSHGKMITCLVLPLVSLSLYPSTTSAQSTTDTSMCAYKETRQNVPLNPKTSQPQAGIPCPGPQSSGLGFGGRRDWEWRWPLRGFIGRPIPAVQDGSTAIRVFLAG